MKLFKFFAIAIAIFVVALAGCQKELDWDLSQPSVGTLKADAAGDCLPSSVHGIYKKDSLLRDSNYVYVSLNVSSPGTWVVKSDTTNGMIFKDSGAIATPGVYAVKVRGYGKPVAEGPTTVFVKYNTSICSFDIDVLSSTAQPAAFSFTSASGGCTAPVLAGTYTAGTPVTQANTLTIQVNVTDTGYYSISTNNINGVTFSTTGVFDVFGAQTVTLTSIGTPAAAGTFTGTVSGGGTSSCTFPMTVNSTGGTTNAVYTFNVSGANCSVTNTSGTYAQGTAMTSGNTVTLSLNVTTAGAYNISTNGNGVTFSGSGNVNSGTQNVVLTASGTPSASGTINYTVTSGSSTCSFPITYTGSAPAASTDYMIMTTNTNYSDRDSSSIADTSFYKFTGATFSFGGNTYNTMYAYYTPVTPNPDDSAYYRKAAGKYYQFFGDIGLDNPVNKEIKLLDSTLAVGATWTDNLGNNSYGGVPITLQVTATILAKNASATIAGNTYNSNIIKVKQVVMMNGVPSSEIYTWYVRGKGILYQRFYDPNAGTNDTYETFRFQIF